MAGEDVEKFDLPDAFAQQGDQDGADVGGGERFVEERAEPFADAFDAERETAFVGDDFQRQ